MEHHTILGWIRHNSLFLIMLPANILAVEAIIRQAAVDKGYPKVVSLCDRIAQFIGFIQDVIAGLIKKNQTPKTGG